MHVCLLCCLNHSVLIFLGEALYLFSQSHRLPCGVICIRLIRHGPFMFSFAATSASKETRRWHFKTVEMWLLCAPGDPCLWWRGVIIAFHQRCVAFEGQVEPAPKLTWSFPAMLLCTRSPPFASISLLCVCGAVGIFNDGLIGVHLGTFHICVHFTSATSARVYSLTKLLFPLDGLSWNFPLRKPVQATRQRESPLFARLMGNVIVTVQEMAWQKKLESDITDDCAIRLSVRWKYLVFSCLILQIFLFYSFVSF